MCSSHESPCNQEVLSNTLLLLFQALTNCITQLNRLDCESESEHQNRTGNESDELANGEVGGKMGFGEAGPHSGFLSLIKYVDAPLGLWAHIAGSVCASVCVGQRRVAGLWYNRGRAVDTGFSFPSHYWALVLGTEHWSGGETCFPPSWR